MVVFPRQHGRLKPGEKFQQLKKHGVEHELITIPHGEHGLGGGDAKLIAGAYESALTFVNRHVKQ